MKFLLIVSLIFIFNDLRAGEIDGRGVICKIYGDTIGYFFEGDRTHEYKLTGGEEKLELKKKILVNTILMKIIFILVM